MKLSDEVRQAAVAKYLELTDSVDIDAMHAALETALRVLAKSYAPKNVDQCKATYDMFTRAELAIAWGGDMQDALEAALRGYTVTKEQP